MVNNKPETGKTKPVRRKFDIVKLNNRELSSLYASSILKHLQSITSDDQDMDKVLEHTSKPITGVAENTIEYSKMRHQDWFDDYDQGISQLIDAKRQASLSSVQNPRS
ncbi:Hypothetical predicted protein [Octopus vulgaris]|uniref:Uncharacterized protein n=1 Tax=Octopus vulgaris TaxID=6645 RepID=A0AA36F7T0_OCTVU|nr:Hypothetical predicted protein [Octopus vulgaris]